jgi:membrane protease subunit (stomatin/prohibitin family)
VTDVATLELRLSQAEEQYHRLLTGQAAKVFVDQNGERIEYVAANAARLAAYIEELKRLLGQQTVSGPLKIWL